MWEAICGLKKKIRNEFNFPHPVNFSQFKYFQFLGAIE